MLLPDSIWEIIQSSQSLSPRGLQNPFAESNDCTSQNQNLAQFFYSPRQPHSNPEKHQFSYVINVWNGKEANPVVKASAISKASELNSLFISGRDHVLKVLFSGGVIRDKKLQRGSVFTFAEVMQSGSSEGVPSADQLQTLYESMSLLKWIIRPPQEVVSRTQTPRLTVLQ